MQKKTWIKVMSAAFAVILMVGLFATTSNAQAASGVDALAKGGKTKPAKAEYSLAKGLWKNLMTSAEKATGLDKDALRAALDGQSLAQVLKGKNVDLASVEATAKADTRAAIDQLVADGKLTQKHATKIESRLDSVTEKLVNKVHHAHKKVTPGATPAATSEPTTAS